MMMWGMSKCMLKMAFTVLEDAIPYSLVNAYRHFEETWVLYRITVLPGRLGKFVLLKRWYPFIELPDVSSKKIVILYQPP
jgi:hypothetical protein